MKNFLLLFFLITVFVCKSQNPGDVAQNFGTYVGFDGAVKDIQVQNDGKILVGGLFESYRGHKEGHLIRLNPDGTKDTTFELGVGFNGTVITLAIQLDGKILVGGDFQTYNGLTQNNIIRLNSDGSKDTTFNIGNGCDRSVESIVLQPDGKILIGGDFSHINNELMGRIVRLNSDGSKDTSFNIGNGFNSAVVALALQTDGKILIGGWFTTYNGVNSPCLIRLNTDGSKDSTFDVGSGFESAVNSLAMQTDGKIVVGGNFNTYKGLIRK